MFHVGIFKQNFIANLPYRYFWSNFLELELALNVKAPSWPWHFRNARKRQTKTRVKKESYVAYPMQSDSCSSSPLCVSLLIPFDNESKSQNEYVDREKCTDPTTILVYCEWEVICHAFRIFLCLQKNVSMLQDNKDASMHVC